MIRFRGGGEGCGRTVVRDGDCNMVVKEYRWQCRFRLVTPTIASNPTIPIPVPSPSLTAPTPPDDEDSEGITISTNPSGNPPE